MFKLLIIAIVLASLNETRASSLNFGKCPEEPVIADFDITKVIFQKLYKLLLNLKIYLF